VLCFHQGVVERFVSANVATLLRSSFAGLWALDGDESGGIIDAAIANPHAYVLKPQREGGGNNLYGDDLVARLRDRTGLGAYILMQRIQPPMHRALFMRQGKVTASDALSELGIYSVYLGHREKSKQALRNEAVGHLLRTKTANSNEGGVAAGFAVLDSPLLV
jgi:glutathione synthase